MITGAVLMGARDAGGSRFLRALEPSTGLAIEPRCAAAGVPEVDIACALATSAFPCYAASSLEPRAGFLRAL